MEQTNQISIKELKPIFSAIQKFSSIDFPGELSMILFTGGCNFRCSYCHNPSFVIPDQIKFKQNQEILEFLNKRKDTLDAVVICGGEPTIHQENLIDWIRYIKSLGYKVKLDTNATNPQLIEQIIKENIIDYFAIDYKAPIDKYEKIIIQKIPQLKEKLFTSLKLIIDSKIPYEIRSTIHNDLHNSEDINQMIKELKEISIDNYFLQNFVAQDNMVGIVGEGVGTRTLLEEFKDKLKDNFSECGVRNLD
jgi:pyruvate formate lyase activating enzyme